MNIDSIQIIKKQFLSEQNTEYLLKLISARNENAVSMTHIKHDLFTIQNEILNKFIEAMCNIKNKSHMVDDIESYLIHLNKMTIVKVEGLIDSNRLVSNSFQNVVSNSLQTAPDASISKPLDMQSTSTQTVDTCQELRPLRLHVFSDSIRTSHHSYIISTEQKFSKICLDKFTLYNNFYNIKSDNNCLELQEGSSKKRISVPVGNYSLDNLLETLELVLNENSIYQNQGKAYNVVLNKTKNRINISGCKTFAIRFIDTDMQIVSLRKMLGFSRGEYMNNDNYTSDTDSCVGLYNNLYISLKGKDSRECCQYYSSCGFSYFAHVNFDSIGTFRSTQYFDLNEEYDGHSTNEIEMTFFHKSMNSSMFYLVKDHIVFDIKLFLL